MGEEVYKIYNNDIGVSFQWSHIESDLTQIVFKEMGFNLSEKEIEIFINKVGDAKNQKNCATCVAGEHCKSILLQTPFSKVSMAISKVELGQIEDLLKGTLFQLRLNNYLWDVCRN